MSASQGTDKKKGKKEIQMEENKTDNSYDRRNEKRKRKMT